MTAVFPTRFPVPMTAIEGSPNGSNRGGSKRKSGPSYGTPERERAAGEREPLGGPSTGSSERSTTTSGACSATADSSDGASGTP